MAVYEEPLAIDWPSEFIVEYFDGTRECLVRGDGVSITPSADDPSDCGFLCADLPRKHPRNQEHCGRYIRFTEMRAIYAPDGGRLWPAD